jgi:hypothetical protein
MLASGMMGRTVAEQRMMKRQVAQRMMRRQIVLHRSRGRGFLCDGVIGNAHGKRNRGDKGLDHGDILLQEGQSQLPRDRVQRAV